MKIAIITHNYSPESSGIGYYSTEMAEYLAKNNEVTVITAFPYYPQWKIYKEYVSRPNYFEEEIRGVKVLRYKMYTPESPNFISRIWQMMSFYRGSIQNIKAVQQADKVVVVCPFTISILLGKKLANIQKAKLWVHIQDFEFDAAIQTGILSRLPFVSRILEKVERNWLNKADIASSISHAMLKKLQSKTSSRVQFFPNWINEQTINPSIAKKHPYFIEGKINVLYSGNIGAKQDWDSYIQLAEEYRENENIHFILVGDGAEKEKVVHRIREFKNINYYPPVELEALNDLLCSADLHILLQKPEVVDTVMPSKLLGMMASEKPSFVVGNAESEVRLHMQRANAGVYISSNDSELIKTSFQEELKTIDRFNGAFTRNYVIEHFSYEKVLNKFQNELESL